LKVKIEMIFRRSETDGKISEKQSWRTYQTRLKRTAAKKRLAKGIFKYTPFLAIIAVAAFALTVGFIRSINYYACKKIVPAIDTVETVFKESKKISKNSVRNLLGNHSFVNLKDKRFNITFDDKNYWVDTTLDISLQNFILKKIDRSTSKYIGIVIMEPLTGRILSMIGFNRIDTSSNPCVDKKFPAAGVNFPEGWLFSFTLTSLPLKTTANFFFDSSFDQFGFVFFFRSVQWGSFLEKPSLNAGGRF